MRLLFEASPLKNKLSEYLTSSEQFLLLFNDASIESIQDSLNILIEYYDSIRKQGIVRDLEYILSGGDFNFFGFYFYELHENSTVNDVRFHRPLTLYSKDYVDALVREIPKILNL